MGVVLESTGSELIALFAILLSVVYYYAQWKYNYWHRRGVKFLPPSFPFGNFTSAFLQRTSFGDLSMKMYKDGHNEKFVGLYTGMHPTLLIRDPELIRTVFIKDFAHFHDRGVYCDEVRDPLSGHLFSLPGEKWKNLRGKLSPTFTSGKMKAMFPTLVDCGGPLVNYVNKAAAKQETVEMRELLAQYTTNIIASVAFGIEIDCIADPETSFRKYGRKVFEPSVWNGIRGVTSLVFPKLMPILKMKSIDQDVEDFILSVVRQNMEYREQNNVSRKDFFQLLLQLRNTGTIQVDGLWDTKIAADEKHKQLSINECAAQAFVFFLAGFETSSTTMSFALYEFAKNPECQLKAQQEIEEVLKKHDGKITYESVLEMKYLDYCIDETLRKYPPVAVLNRECTKTWTIPNTNIQVEPGTAIILPAYGIQYDEKYYPEPEKFIPERFSPENYSNKSFIEMPYMPFGEGPRNCIGLRFGKMQSKVGLIFMLQNYSYQLAGNTKNPLVLSISSFLLAPEGGMNLKVTKRM